MNTNDLRSVLADQASHVDVTGPLPIDELRGRITTSRRRRTGATTAAVSVVFAGLVALSVQGAPDGGPDPAPDPAPDPTPGRTVNADGTVTIIPDVGPGDALGWETLARRSTTDPGREDDVDLSVTVDDQVLLAETDFSCRGTADTWYVVSYLDGAGGYLPCLRTAQPVAYPAELVPNEQPDEPETLGEVRMFLTEPGQLNCWDTPSIATPQDFEACVADYEPLADVPAGVTAELVVWGHPDPPTAATILGSDYGALGILDGTEYLLDQAVLSAPGATTMSLQLEPAGTTRMVCVLRATGAEVLLDGQRPPRSQRLTTTIEWGEPCVFVDAEVTLELWVDAGTSQDSRFALVVWEARP